MKKLLVVFMVLIMLVGCSGKSNEDINHLKDEYTSYNFAKLSCEESLLIHDNELKSGDVSEDTLENLDRAIERINNETAKMLKLIEEYKISDEILEEIGIGELKLIEQSN